MILEYPLDTGLEKTTYPQEAATCLNQKPLSMGKKDLQHPSAVCCFFVFYTNDEYLMP